MARTAGYSSVCMLRVQSPVAAVISIGRGAIMDAISTLLVPMRRLGAFSHRPPPCMMNDTMLAGAEKRMRSSTAATCIVWVAPPDAPVAPIWCGFTPGSDFQKIDRANRVPQLQAERAETPKLLHRLVAEIVRRLNGVVVPHHVVGEHHVPLPRQVDARAGTEAMVVCSRRP